MKAILIARVSTEEQKEAGNSLPAQIARLERYCQTKGFTVLKAFSFDESAYSNEREDFDRILEFIDQQKGKIALCCDKVDRLSRNIFDKRISLLYEKALKDLIELHFVSDGQVVTSNISAVEKFHFGMSLGLAKYYSDAVSDNVKRGNEQKLRRGELPGKAPYGYNNIRGQDGKSVIVINAFAAGVVKKAFELYATGTHSLGTLREKIKKDYGITWSQGYTDLVLKNPFYHGTIARKGNLYPHNYPTIITKTLFDEVQAIKSGFNKKPVKFATWPYIYRGLIRCATCDLTITAGRHKGHVYYHCTEYAGKHGTAWMREEDLTAQFAAIFKRLELPKEMIQQCLDILENVHKDKISFQTKQFDELIKEQKMVTKMVDNLYLDKLKGSIAESVYDKFYLKFREQLADIESRLARLKEAETNYFVTVKYLLALVTNAHELFISSQDDARRQLIRLLLLNLRLEGRKLVYDVQKPFDVIINANDCQVWCARQDLNLWPAD